MSFLKVMPKRGVVRFGNQGKLSLRHIGPIEILERVGTFSYRLALPPNLSGCSCGIPYLNALKYTPNPTHVVELGEFVVDADGTFKEGPVSIMDSRGTSFARQVC